jgi:protocatechuate 3,4-dioxygenase beta subunit
MDGSTYGPNGAIRVDGLLPGTYEVTPSCEEPSHAGSAVEVTIADRDVVDQTWTVPAAAAIPVRGRVLSAAGAPVAGARIIVEWARGATSGADGRYELDLAPGAYDVDVVSEAGVLPEKRRVLVANAPIQQDLVLADGGAIRGRIVDGDGRPLSGVRIALDDRDQPSGTDGSFLFEQIKPGAHAVDAIPHDGASLEQEVTVRAHETTAVTFTAEAMSTELRGTVLGVDGHPAKNAFVTIARELDGNVRAYARDAPRILTGADGTFAQTKLPGGVYTVRAFDDTGDALAEHVRSGTTVRLQLKPTGTISGVVRRGAVGVRDLRVYLDDRATGVRRRERFYETDGRYRLADVPPGSYLLSATDGDAEVHVHVDVGDARPVVVDLSLDDTITLTGRVLDFATNAPAAGALVWARSQYTSHSSTADAAGTFSIPGVAAGTVELEVGGEHAYWIHQITREVDRSSSNLGDLFAVAASTDYKDVGRLGIRFASDAPSIQAIDPSSPAAASGLVVGDVVTSINGVDVSSADVQLAADLLYVPVGAPVQLGLARGVTVTIVAAPRSTDR